MADDRLRAADLPDGSVVATESVAYIKTNPAAWAQWRGTDGGYWSDAAVDERLRQEGQVLRYGFDQPRQEEGGQVLRYGFDRPLPPLKIDLT